MRNAAAITGIGVITPIGIGIEDFARGLAESKCGITEITGFDAEHLPVQLAGEAQTFDLNNHISSVKTYIDRASAFALAASAMALGQSRWIGNVPGAEIGLCLGSAFGCQDSIELYTRKLMESDPKFAPPLVFTHGYANAANCLVSIEFGLRGHNTCFAGGDTSGSAALDYALSCVRQDSALRILAGGMDVMSEVAMRMALDAGRLTTDLCRPFDAAADGTLLGECACLLALESVESATGRDAEVFGYLMGMAAASVPSPATAATRAIEAALADAGVEPDALGAVFASASGVRELDNAEAFAIAGLSGRPPVVALKSLIGEPAGAWMPVAIAAALACIEKNILPVTANLRTPVSHEINIVRQATPPKNDACLVLNLSHDNYATAAVVRGA